MKKQFKMKEIKSSSGYMGKRLICESCLGEVEIIDSCCRWCGVKFPNSLMNKVIDLKIK